MRSFRVVVDNNHTYSPLLDDIERVPRSNISDLKLLWNQSQEHSGNNLHRYVDLADRSEGE